MEKHVRVTTKPPSTVATIEQWACSRCARKYFEKEKADACCVCVECKKRLVDLEKKKRGGYGSDTCERCVLKVAIRHAQENIRKHEASLESSRAHLAKLQEEKDAIDLAEKNATKGKRT